MINLLAHDLVFVDPQRERSPHDLFNHVKLVIAFVLKHAEVLLKGENVTSIVNLR